MVSKILQKKDMILKTYNFESGEEYFYLTFIINIKMNL